jgi:hypothetical protein
MGDTANTIRQGHEAQRAAAAKMLAALERMIADLREQEATHLCSRMRIEQISDLARAIDAAKAAGIKTAQTSQLDTK